MSGHARSYQSLLMVFRLAPSRPLTLDRPSSSGGSPGPPSRAP